MSSLNNIINEIFDGGGNVKRPVRPGGKVNDKAMELFPPILAELDKAISAILLPEVQNDLKRAFNELQKTIEWHTNNYYE